MKLYKSSIIDDSEKAKKIAWAELVIYVTDLKKLHNKQAVKWLNNFEAIKIAAAVERPVYSDQRIQWHTYDLNATKTEIFNQLIAESPKEWILFLEDGEIIEPEKLPEIEPDKNTWIPGLLKSNFNGSGLQQYQIRLVHKSDKNIFSGKNLPDATYYIIKNGIQLNANPFTIWHSEELKDVINPEDELSVAPPTPRAYLAMGEQYFKQRKYVHAAAQYRQILKKEKLLPFDRLAAVNGLAGCMTEQYKWPKALTLTEQSLHAEPYQRMPYLIRFRIFQLKKQWKEAHEILNRYHSVMNVDSKANFDKSICEEDTLAELGEVALKAGMIQKSFEHFEELYSVKNGEVDREFLKRLFVLSADLNDYDKTVFYFERLFSPYLPDKLSRQALEQLNDCTEFFMKQGWYNYVLKTYEELVEVHPQNSDFRRKLVVALSKTNRMERARELISKR